MADSEVRQRKGKGDEKKPKAEAPEEEEVDKYTPWVDILRVISFLIVASCGLSYVLSGGTSWTWGGIPRPEYTTLEWWKSQFVRPTKPHLPPDEKAS